LRGFLVFLIFLPLEIWHKFCCHNFETIFNTCERGVFYYLVYSHDQVMQNNSSTISSFHFKSSSEFFFLLHFQRTHQSSSYYCTFASHACNLDFCFIYNLLLSFDYIQVTIQHDTIQVHEYCWDSLKSSPRILLFSVILR